MSFRHNFGLNKDFRCDQCRLGSLAVASLMLILSFGSVRAATSANAQSPLGTNLQGVSYWSSEYPFLNVFATGGSWVTNGPTYDTGEEQYLQLDANGYPTTLTASAADPHKPQLFTNVQMLMFYNLPNTPNGYYPAGNYVVLYDGAGTLNYGLDAKIVSSSPGRDVINVANPKQGISLALVATDPNHTGNYLRNIRVVQAANEAALTAGQIFTPRFLNSIQNFRVLRFMDWLETNNNTLVSWSSRPVEANAFWGLGNGVPIEVAVSLANAVSADAWLNVPHMADNNYITQMASLVHAQLGNTQKVYIEYSNEVWNTIFSQSSYAQSQGQSTFPAGLGSPYDYLLNWYGLRAAQTCDIWKSVWGADANRVICILGAQAANTYTATESLNCPLWKSGSPCSGHGIGAVAIAPYFGGPVPSAWTSQADGGLTELFASLTTQNDPSIPAGGWLGQVSGWEVAYANLLTTYKLPLLAYEGGQNFIGFPTYLNGSSMVQLFAEANVDPRMNVAYTQYLNQWKANGGQTFVNFSDSSPYSQYGQWGALQSFMQTISPLSIAPPKWQALQNFITTNACWWSACTGAISSSSSGPLVPMAPSGLKVQ
jgi:hypothetical protein